MSFFKDLKEDIAQSVNELTESLDENLTVDDEKTKETVPMSELTTDFPPEEPTEEVPVITKSVFIFRFKYTISFKSTPSSMIGWS